MRWINVGTGDRLLRIVLGGGLLVLGTLRPTVLSDLWWVLGGLLLVTGFSGFCLVYRILGIDTCGRRPGSRSRTGLGG